MSYKHGSRKGQGKAHVEVRVYVLESYGGDVLRGWRSIGLWYLQSRYLKGRYRVGMVRGRRNCYSKAFQRTKDGMESCSWWENMRGRGNYITIISKDNTIKVSINTRSKPHFFLCRCSRLWTTCRSGANRRCFCRPLPIYCTTSF